MPIPPISPHDYLDWPELSPGELEDLRHSHKDSDVHKKYAANQLAREKTARHTRRVEWWSKNWLGVVSTFASIVAAVFAVLTYLG